MNCMSSYSLVKPGMLLLMHKINGAKQKWTEQCSPWGLQSLLWQIQSTSPFFTAVLERWFMYLDNLEAQVAFVEHDNFIFICSFIYHVPQGEQLFSVGEYSTAPGRVPFMTNHNLFFKRLDCFIQNCRVLILIWAGELVLVVRYIYWKGQVYLWKYKNY